MEKYLSPSEVCEVVPGLTESLLAQMRYRGDGPPFAKPSPRKVVYSESKLQAWLSDREQASTREVARA
jgi:hypothetical protein